MGGYIILRHALALRIHKPQIVLRGGITRFEGAVESFCGLGIILRHAMAIAVHHPQNELRGDIASFSQGEPLGIGGLIIPSFIGRRCLVKIGGHGATSCAD